MKWLCALTAIAVSLPAAVNPQLKQVTTVYVLSMRSGLDQFLANQLSASGIFQVVTDPQKADAILTDHLGEPFENKLKELYPPPPPPKKEKEKDDSTVKSAISKDDKEKDKEEAAFTRPSGYVGGKGNIFLVDRKSRLVLWSIYERPKNATPGELTRTSERVIRRLKDDLTDKKQSLSPQ